MPRIDARRVLRFVARGLAWLTGGVLLVALAWVLSNLRDIEPAARPALLALPAPQLRDEANAFFALVGLNAGADRDPAVAGRALWRSQLAFAALAQEQRYLKAAGEAMVRSEQDAQGSRLPGLSGVPLLCDTDRSGCAEQWIAQADALAVQRQTHATLGARCEQLLDKSFALEERLPPFQSAADPLAAHSSGAASCSKWLLSGAVLAWTQQRPGQAVALLTQADRLNRALLAGSHSLIAQLVAQRLAHQTLNAVVTLAVRDPALASALAPVLAPGPDQAQAVRRWIAVEAAFQRGAIDDVSRSCLTLMDVVGRDQVSFWDGLVGSLDRLACRHRIGWHPERTLAVLDARWLDLVAALDSGLPAAIGHQAAAAQAAAAGPRLTWRNPVGNLMLAVSESTYVRYLTRHADLELHREAAALALAAQTAGIAPAERGAWLVRQPQSALARGRIEWDASGLALTTRPWQQEYAGAAFNPGRDAIRIAWPAAP